MRVGGIRIARINITKRKGLRIVAGQARGKGGAFYTIASAQGNKATAGELVESLVAIGPAAVSPD